MITYADAGAAYSGICREVLSTGAEVAAVESPTSPSRGATTVEVLAHSFAIADPRARVAEVAARPLNVAFPFAAFLNVLGGRCDVESTAWYNPLASRFSDDGRTLRGAYGPRILIGLRHVVRLLKRDPSTRRAVVNVFDHEVDFVESVDVPCPVSVQFLARGGRLHCVASFRSQNAAAVFPYDVALFTLLHEHVAAQAGLELGTYVQHTGSMHVYGAGARADERPLAEGVAVGRASAWPMPPMGAVTGDQVERVLDAERAVRERGDDSAIDRLGDLPTFWWNMIGLLRAFSALKRAGSDHLRDARAVRLAFGGVI